MRLCQFLNENEGYTVDEIISLIKRDCKPFLKEFNIPLYRGVKNETDDFIKKTVRKDRNPSDMSPLRHERYDKIFKERFGWKPRSEGMFATKIGGAAEVYGTLYHVFPIGHYKYLYSENIYDLLFLNPPKDDDDLYELISNSYETFGLNKASIKSEIMIKCDSYYGVRSRSTIIDEVWNGITD